MTDKTYRCPHCGGELVVNKGRLNGLYDLKRMASFTHSNPNPSDSPEHGLNGCGKLVYVDFQEGEPVLLKEDPQKDNGSTREGGK